MNPMSFPPHNGGELTNEEYWRFFRASVEEYCGREIPEAEWSVLKAKADFVDKTGDRGNLANIVHLATLVRMQELPDTVSRKLSKSYVSSALIWIASVLLLLVSMATIIAVAGISFDYGRNLTQMETKLWEMAKYRMFELNGALKTSIDEFKSNAWKYSSDEAPVLEWVYRLDQQRQTAFVYATRDSIQLKLEKKINYSFLEEDLTFNWEKCFFVSVVIVGLFFGAGVFVGKKLGPRMKAD